MFYYASKISPNMARTPEGFLVCTNVPIARTGKQIYLASELPIDHPNPDERIEVYRDEADVFSKAAMASFEGKPVSNDHPYENEITPQNARNHTDGVTTNIRRGQGEDVNKLLADLLIYDATLISEIESGKREVSCGYGCDFVIENGRVYQKNIVGNHVAVVTAGRAGSRIAIKDESPEIETQGIGVIPPKYERRTTRMGKNKKKPSERSFAGVLANIWPLFAKDAAPEEVVEAVEDLIEAIEEEVGTDGVDSIDRKDEAARDEKDAKDSKDAKDTKDTKDDEAPAWAAAMMEEIKRCNDRLDAMDAAKDTDPLEKLEEELKGESEASADSDDDEVEAELIEPAEDIEGDAEESESNDSDTADMEDEAGFVMPPSGRPTTGLNKNAKDAALKEIRRMKPIIAAIPDPKKRKAMSDSMAKLLRVTLGLPTGNVGNKKANNYANVMATQQRNAAKRVTKDSAANPDKRAEDMAALAAKKIAESRSRQLQNKKN